jgi:thiamine-phosphate pyrophosphorylase
VRPRNLICLVTDRQRLSPGRSAEASLERLADLVGAAAESGVDLIQLRERDLPARDLVTLAVRCVERAGLAQILINDRLDVALAARAHGVHLRSDSVDAAVVRRLVPADFLIGRSVHGAVEAAETGTAGRLDYLMFGTVFSTVSKPSHHPVSGLRALADACGAAPAPVLAIGGITLDRVAAVISSGASGVAAIGLFIPPDGVPFLRHASDVVERLREMFDTTP